MLSRITPAEAVNIITAAVAPLATETVPLSTALGRVLATDVRSLIDLPYRDNSAMDGYAVRSHDIVGRCPVELEIVERIPAGTTPKIPLGEGQCSRIFTGAPIPQGADSVVRQEHTTQLGGSRVRIDEATDACANIRLHGEDILRGSVALKSELQLGAAHIGVLASLAETYVCVYRKPTVAVMATGDEIADLAEREAILSGEKIASSNTYTLTSMVQQAGGEVTDLGIASDDPADLRNRIAAAADADLLITSGGVSVGEHDHLRPVLQEMGADMKFWRIRMRPGAPVGFAVLNGLPWIGLPGNPVSAMVGFELFVRPAIRKMLGHEKLFRGTVAVTTESEIHLKAPLCHFLRVVITEQDGKRYASLTGAQGSGILSSMAAANALMIVPEDNLDVERGSELNAMYLEESRHVGVAPF